MCEAIQAFNGLPDRQVHQRSAGEDLSLIRWCWLGHEARRFLRQGIDLVHLIDKVGHDRVVQRCPHERNIDMDEAIDLLIHEAGDLTTDPSHSRRPLEGCDQW